ncbi:ubiquitin-conjugating enzyme E2 variant [Clonorchis sinensis]|uniref:Ubiquitin-conjugating enzyme E2 variant n=1 Tax=Clonorchis sinensis TaxID=79923 RepID=G7YA37_CLOSI|nr:ubiquitin-conjugating enzyme E2 variant [Clonorchis sinensis]
MLNGLSESPDLFTSKKVTAVVDPCITTSRHLSTGLNFDQPMFRLFNCRRHLEDASFHLLGCLCRLEQSGINALAEFLMKFCIQTFLVDGVSACVTHGLDIVANDGAGDLPRPLHPLHEQYSSSSYPGRTPLKPPDISSASGIRYRKPEGNSHHLSTEASSRNHTTMQPLRQPVYLPEPSCHQQPELCLGFRLVKDPWRVVETVFDRFRVTVSWGVIGQQTRCHSFTDVAKRTVHRRLLTVVQSSRDASDWLLSKLPTLAYPTAMASASPEIDSRLFPTLTKWTRGLQMRHVLLELRHKMAAPENARLSQPAEGSTYRSNIGDHCFKQNFRTSIHTLTAFLNNFHKTGREIQPNAAEFLVYDVLHMNVLLMFQLIRYPYNSGPSGTNICAFSHYRTLAMNLPAAYFEVYVKGAHLARALRPEIKPNYQNRLHECLPDVPVSGINDQWEQKSKTLLKAGASTRRIIRHQLKHHLYILRSLEEPKGPKIENAKSAGNGHKLSHLIRLLILGGLSVKL